MIRLATPRHGLNPVSEGDADTRPDGHKAPLAEFLASVAPRRKSPLAQFLTELVRGHKVLLVSGFAAITRRCKRAWLHAWSGLRSANGKVTKQFTALSERQSSTRAEVLRLENAFRELCANVDTLHARIHELEGRDRGAGLAHGAGSLNLNSKSQVLKLSRNGQSPRTIAATLSVPVGEVEFLLKVQRLLDRSARQRQAQIGDGGDRANPKAIPSVQQGTLAALKIHPMPCEAGRVQ